MSEVSPGLGWLDDGESGRVLRAIDWSNTPLGPLGSWPASLRAAVSLCLGSPVPLAVVWGPERTLIHNDAYGPLCGAMRPRPMGQDFLACWDPPPSTLGPALERALAGEAASLEDQRLFVGRRGGVEEAFFTLSFSPIRDEAGRVAGVFHAAVETTAKVVGERRIRALRDVALRAGGARSVDEAYARALAALEPYAADLPFALLYELDEREGHAHLRGGLGLPAEHAAARADVPLGDASGWPLASVAASARSQVVDELGARFGAMSAVGPYPDGPVSAVALPVFAAGVEGPAAVLVVGASARLPFDDDFRVFAELLAGAVGAAVNDARAYDAGRTGAAASERALLAAELHREREAARRKDEFLAGISHELRTPLNAMLGWARLLAVGTLGPEQQAHGIATIARNATAQAKLLDDMLDAARAERDATFAQRPSAAAKPPSNPPRSVAPDHDSDAPPDVNGLRVLLVDDDPDTLDLLAAVLSGAGALVTAAGSVAEALATFQRQVPDVVVSDIGMPGRDGYDLIRSLRERADLADVPAVALTAYTRPEDRRRALRSGFNLHVAKPVDPGELLEVVASLARRLSPD